ncbi:MAG: hypothetical protein A2Z02_02455 [Chloroflexi bacterium RBG_16_48_7]|nr:MAG: hypothetical protein A2Z02_02455 [Chloroflexi bacterium RBG_16_48_7]
MNSASVETGTEQALYITRIDGLKYYQDKFSRIYFGNEFCQRLIPAASDIRLAIDFALNNNLSFTFITPFVTNEGLELLKPLIDLVAREKPGSEIVFNDWGILQVLNRQGWDLQPVMGRLLNKMKRGPRLMNLLDILPDAAIEYYRGSNISTGLYSKFLKQNRVRRVELDNLLQGINLKLADTEIVASLYLPYAYITVSRFCLAASCDVYGDEDRVGIFPCHRECQKYTFQQENPVMGIPLLRKGNAIYFRNDKVPENMREQHIDRIVFQPELPA